MQRICNMVSLAIGIAHRVPRIRALAAQMSLTKQASKAACILALVRSRQFRMSSIGMNGVSTFA
jgi:hypothetical protein